MATPPPPTPQKGKLEVATEFVDVPRPYLCKCKLRVFFFLTCSTASLISLYTIYVKHNMALNSNSYQPLCDISERVSCSKVFLTRYSHGFGILGLLFGDESIFNLDNGFLGIFYYSFIGMLSLSNSLNVAKSIIYICAISNLMSIYLGYLLYILDDLCIICVTIYIINLLQFIMAYQRYYKCVEDEAIRLNNERIQKMELLYNKGNGHEIKSPESKKDD